MKTIYLVSFLLTCFLSFSSAQNFTDDIYFTPADASKDASKVKVRPDKPRYKNGAKEIIFKDSSQGKTVVLDQDTVYFLSEMNDSIAMAETTDTDQEEGYYLDGFEGGEMEYEYAERIRRFHNPKFSIHISDPQYMDIYFLDDSKWNVYIDGSYAWVTPTWTNPYWFNYYWAPYSYSSWYWRTNPYAYHSWYYSNPWTYGLYGWTGYSPWYYGYYDWGYPYYGGYYGYYGGYYGHYYGGWGYPYYHHPYYWGSYTTVSRNKNYSEPVRRRAISSGSSGASSVSTNTRISGGSYSPVVGRSTVVSNERSSGGTSTGTRPTELRSTVKSTSNVSTARSAAINTRISGVDTRTRTVTTSGNIDRGRNTIVPIVRQTQTQTRNTSGTVSSSTRSTRTVTTPTRSSTTVRAGTGGSSTLRSAVTTPGRSSSSSTSTYSPSVRSSSSSRSTYSAPTRSSSSSSSSSYSAPSRSSSSSSSSSYSAPSSSSSGGSSRSSGGSFGGRR
ncbi:MAG: hypothetical protein ACOX7E_05295 [Paludibacter sp.]